MKFNCGDSVLTDDGWFGEVIRVDSDDPELTYFVKSESDGKCEWFSEESLTAIPEFKDGDVVRIARRNPHYGGRVGTVTASQNGSYRVTFDPSSRGTSWFSGGELTPEESASSEPASGDDVMANPETLIEGLYVQVTSESYSQGKTGFIDKVSRAAGEPEYRVRLEDGRTVWFDRGDLLLVDTPAVETPAFLTRARTVIEALAPILRGPETSPCARRAIRSTIHTAALEAIASAGGDLGVLAAEALVAGAGEDPLDFPS